MATSIIEVELLEFIRKMYGKQPPVPTPTIDEGSSRVGVGTGDSSWVGLLELESELSESRLIVVELEGFLMFKL